MPDCGMHFIYLPFEASLQTPDRFFSYLFYLPSPANLTIVIWASSFIHDAFMHSLIISFVRTVLRVLPSTHLACWFGQMLTKAISWMKSLIARPTPRGVPVSPMRSCLGHCIIRFRNPEINSSSLTSTLDVLPVEVKLSTTTFPRASSMPPHPCVITALM